MTELVWQEALDTGIDVIDGQHRRIVDMINQLECARHAPMLAVDHIDARVERVLPHQFRHRRRLLALCRGESAADGRGPR